MATKKTNGTRQSPSVERQIALALVRVIECVKACESANTALNDSKKTPDLDHERSGQLRTDMDKALVEQRKAVDEANQVLADNNYGELESIASRVAALELQLKAAMDLKQYKDIAPLGAALERAKKGQTPLPITEKKPKTTTEPRKPRTAKKVAEIIAAFGDGTKFVAANGDAVTAIRASETGKQCSVQFGDEEWIEVEPAELTIAPEKGV